MFALDASDLIAQGDHTAVPVGTSVSVSMNGGAAVVSVVDAVSFDPASGRTTFVLHDPVLTPGVFDASFATDLKELQYDTPIDGLEDGHPYWVQVVDDHTIRLFASPDGGKPIDLTEGDGVTLGQGLGIAHELDTSDCSGGVCIRTELSTAYDGINATATLSDSSDSKKATIASTLTGNIGSLESLLGLFDMVGQVAKLWPEKSPVMGTSTVGAAGAIDVLYANHVVLTEIGPTAHIKSSANLDVTAEIDQVDQVAAASSTTKPMEKGKDEASASASIAIAIGVAIIQNTAKTLIDGGAHLDAHDTTTVSAVVQYPFASQNPATAVNPADYWKGSGPDGWAYAQDGTLGYSSNLFNTFVLATGSQAKVSVGASLSLDFFTNVAQALIESGALVNQTEDMRFRSGLQASPSTQTRS